MLVFHDTSESMHAALFNSALSNNPEEVKNILKEIKWDSETIGLFQASVHSNYFRVQCHNTAVSMNIHNRMFSHHVI